MRLDAGVDIGGTKSAAVLVDERGDVVAEDWHEHGADQVADLPALVVEALDRVLARAGRPRDHVAHLGVAVAGLVRDDRSTLVNSAKIRVTGLDLGGALRDALGLAVAVENDATATLYGHLHRAESEGRRRPSDVTLLITLGTGTGGAIMANGRPITGAHGFAAELGHVLVDPDDDRVCLCGAPGCVENYASGRGLQELARLSPPPAATRTRLGLEEDAPLRSPDVVALAELGDPWAVGLLEHAGRMLGRALTILCVALDPGEIVIGGSFGHATRRWLLPAAHAEMVARWPFPGHRSVPEPVVDTIGPFAGAVGAALLGRTAHPQEDTA